MNAPGTAPLAGVVLDASTNRGIPDAVVIVEGLGRRTLADSTGTFLLTNVPTGPLLLRVEGLGYETLAVPASVAPGLEPLEIRLQPSPIELEGIEVRGERRNAAISGVVLDAVTGEGIPWAALWLRDQQRSSTDSQGAFRLNRVPPGSYLLLAQRMGYQGLWVQARVSARNEPVVIRLEPDPIVLEGISVVNDRLKYRRNAYPSLVRTYDEEKLRRAWATDVYGLVVYQILPTIPRRRSGLWGIAPPRGGGGNCPVSGVYIDDQYIMGGLNVLASYHPSQLYLLEVYPGGGTTVRAYTHDYMERRARQPRMLEPADLPPPALPAC